MQLAQQTRARLRDKMTVAAFVLTWIAIGYLLCRIEEITNDDDER
jgi:hypothetical protein